MSYLFQISDPEDLRVTIQIPGKYNPDILDDGARRLAAAYKDALESRLSAARMELELRTEFGDNEGED